MFIELNHNVGVQNRKSIVNTEKIIAINPCYVLAVPECTLFEYLTAEEKKNIPKNPLICDYPNKVVKIVKYDVVCCDDVCFEISIEEYERLNILLGV